ncbi:ribbon-helix-helix domain-containing protein [Photorhabdus temperata subsp. temperata]|uniref:Ribbon-helix-helix protein CopG domain-containing protein n=1 Tax=Photorhabdus temperata J3 TaxID=1389415 RepID=U7R102_PHOTE|nr:ribbon-helix-helix domain-containing protein [Photorhabdus temperata]ERT13190.1 hypothetical protein O185_09995 [Photorhabdus temperata J3]
MATSVKLDDNLKSRVQYLAKVRHRSAHWIMREAIRDYVERKEYPPSATTTSIQSYLEIMNKAS